MLKILYPTFASSTSDSAAFSTGAGQCLWWGQSIVATTLRDRNRVLEPNNENMMRLLMWWNPRVARCVRNASGIHQQWYILEQNCGMDALRPALSAATFWRTHQFTGRSSGTLSWSDFGLRISALTATFSFFIRLLCYVFCLVHSISRPRIYWNLAHLSDHLQERWRLRIPQTS